MKEWHFFDKVYRRWVVLMIGDIDHFIKEMEDMGYLYLEEIVPAKGMCIELTPANTSTSQDCTVVWLAQYETSTLVHELVHLVMNNLDAVGVLICPSNSEAFAFYTEYWFTEIQRARRKHPNGRTPTDVKRASHV